VVSELLFDEPPPYKYLLDTSAAISQRDEREKYPRDVNVTLWQDIDQLIRNRVIVSCSEVSEEINEKDDVISSWFKSVGCVCLPIDEAVQLEAIKILEKFPGIVDFKKNKSSGDVFVIATAIEWNLTVITLEDGRCPDKIPKVCRALERDCLDIHGLCIREGWKY
jgi:hypothetical protein